MNPVAGSGLVQVVLSSGMFILSMLLSCWASAGHEFDTLIVAVPSAASVSLVYGSAGTVETAADRLLGSLAGLAYVELFDPCRQGHGPAILEYDGWDESSRSLHFVVNPKINRPPDFVLPRLDSISSLRSDERRRLEIDQVEVRGRSVVWPVPESVHPREVLDLLQFASTDVTGFQPDRSEIYGDALSVLPYSKRPLGAWSLWAKGMDVEAQTWLVQTARFLSSAEKELPIHSAPESIGWVALVEYSDVNEAIAAFEREQVDVLLDVSPVEAIRLTEEGPNSLLRQPRSTQGAFELVSGSERDWVYVQSALDLRALSVSLNGVVSDVSEPAFGLSSPVQCLIELPSREGPHAAAKGGTSKLMRVGRGITLNVVVEEGPWSAQVVSGLAGVLARSNIRVVVLPAIPESIEPDAIVVELTESQPSGGRVVLKAPGESLPLYWRDSLVVVQGRVQNPSSSFATPLAGFGEWSTEPETWRPEPDL